MPKRPIEKTLDAFQLRDLQAFNNILLTLEYEGWNIQDALDHIDHLTKHGRKDREAFPVMRQEGNMWAIKRRCPECDAMLNLYQVNNHPAVMVGGNFKCQWQCRMCEWEEFSFQEYYDEAKPYIVPMDETLQPKPFTNQERVQARRLKAQKQNGGK